MGENNRIGPESFKHCPHSWFAVGHEPKTFEADAKLHHEDREHRLAQEARAS